MGQRSSTLSRTIGLLGCLSRRIDLPKIRIASHVNSTSIGIRLPGKTVAGSADDDDE